MSQLYLLAAGRELDGRGDIGHVLDLERRLAELGVEPRQFVVDPLKAGWHTPIEPDHFRSGNAPMEALAAGLAAVRAGESRAAVVWGEDLLRSEYVGNARGREQAMSIYGDCTMPEAYTELGYALMRRRGWSVEQFRRLAEAVYSNYLRTVERRGEYKPPLRRHFDYVTELFRAVDCANPAVDFRGRLLVGDAALAEELQIPPAQRVAIAGLGLGRTEHDGPAHADEIAAYQHLARAYQAACAEAGEDFTARFLADQALLEVYSCFPVTPLAFLCGAGIACEPEEITTVLAEHEITVTGGMNLGRGPWNNPVLNGLVVMYQDLCAGRAPLGGVHSTGGLGYRQGFAILRAPAGADGRN